MTNQLTLLLKFGHTQMLGVLATSALVFGPFFGMPLPQTPAPDDAKQLATVTVVVLSTSGTPIAKASAQLLPQRAGTPPANPAGPQPREQVVKADGNGRFVFEKVVPGKYWFAVTHPAYLTPRDNAFGPRPARTLTLGAGQQLDMTVRLLEPATVTGRVVDEDGDPVAQANVQLVRRVYAQGRRRLEAVASNLSGDNGEFKIRDVYPGRYILKADKPPLWISEPVFTDYFGSIPPSSGRESERVPIPAAKPGGKIYNPSTAYFGGSNTEAGATPIDISPGQNMHLGIVKMENRSILHVRGKVVGDPGLLAGGRVAQLRTEDASRLWPWNYGADIEKDGSFDVAYIRAANEITIVVYSRKLEILGWTRITVGQDDVEGVVLNASLAALNGVVRFEGEQPPPDPRRNPMHVSLEGINSFWLTRRSATVDGDGSFTMAALPPGFYTAWLDSPEGSYLKSVRLNWRDLSDQRIDWRGPESGLLELIVSRKAAVLEGTLLGDDGKPASGTVTLVPDPPRPGNTNWYPAATADAQGVFRFPSVTPGRYNLYAWEEIENTAHWNPDYVRPFESRGQSVELQEGDRVAVTAKQIPAAVMRDALRKAGIF